MAVNIQKEITTNSVLKEMLCENTGRHLLDSGGYPTYDKVGNYTGSNQGYGRNWERNQNRDFDSEKATILKFDTNPNQIMVNHNVYHWLKNRLHYAYEWDAMFHDQFVPEVDLSEDKCWLELMEEFGDWLRSKGYEVAGLYGDGEPFTRNTYNGEDCLSQVLQYTYYEVDKGDGWETLVLLQIHGGCDIRGGYTRPRAFYADEYIMMNSDATIKCSEDCDHHWTTDDAYHFYFQGCAGYGAGTQLEEYDFQTVEDWTEENDGIDPFEISFVDPNQIELGFYDQVEVIDKPTYKAYGIVLVDDNYYGYCPICGGKLEAW
jgi:hypothetical protein